MNAEKTTIKDNINTETPQELIDLVVARLKSSPSNLDLSLGGKGTFNLEELIKNVEDRTDIGQQIVEMQLDYLRNLKEVSSYEPELATYN